MVELASGLVTAHLGQGISVECEGELYLCQTLRKLETLAVGDQVEFVITGNGQGRIEAIQPRRSTLLRPSRNNKVRPVAANIDAVFIVCAVEPLCDFLLIDQYLAVCAHSNIAVALVLNKADLAIRSSLKDELAIYQALGYPLYQVSAKQPESLAELKSVLQTQVTIFTGQSGVGKSSLTNALIPDKDLKTNSISATTKHGRHTTTAASLYRLPDGGFLIDSPGVAIFGLADLNEIQLIQGYREFLPLLGQCRFHNCRHVKDMGCAIRAAADNGAIAMSRYQRYLKLRTKMSS